MAGVKKGEDDNLTNLIERGTKAPGWPDSSENHFNYPRRSERLFRTSKEFTDSIQKSVAAFRHHANATLKSA